MRGHSISLAAAAVVCFSLHLALTANAGVHEMVWKDFSGGIIDADLQNVVVSPDIQDMAYTNSMNSVYRTADGGKTWKEVLSFRGTGNTINTITAMPKNEKIILAGTSEGLYRSDDGGSQWVRIFSGIGNLEDSVVSIAVHPVHTQIIFIGTGSGLYRTDNNGKDWNRDNNLPAGSPVRSIAIDNSRADIIYTATGKGIYKSTNNGIDWQRIFVTNLSEINDTISRQDEAIYPEEINTGIEIKSIAIDPADSKIVFAGTTAGLLITQDSGLTWRKAGNSGLINRDIRRLAVSSEDPDSIFAATEKGVFRYSKTSDNWHELYNGLVSSDIRSIAFSYDRYAGSKALWAATRNGLYKMVPVAKVFSDHSKVEAQQVFSEFGNEPTIEEIREAAMSYAEVQPDKISGWRKAAAMKALLPDLTFKYDKNKSWQSDDYYYQGKYLDDDITKDKDSGWSISLSWELGDLIWNDAQTSIDSRSKLMVELRDDILNEVTRLYFERRRMQIEMLLSPHEDIKEKIDKELRLQELTADIDALTGSYLSRRQSQIKKAEKM
jgi:photosystem II stability/assembly factor-like uncharacterized protein